MNILVIGAHPDDEILGAGGAISRWTREGSWVQVLLLTDNGQRHSPPTPVIAQAEAARGVLGYQGPVRVAGLPDQKLERHLQDVCLEIKLALKTLKPDLVVTHSVHDLNLDHRVVAEATLIECRPQNTTANVLAYGMECSNFGNPHGQIDTRLYVPLDTRDLSAKFKAYAQYSGEQVQAPNLRSKQLLLSQMEIDGAKAGTRFAEAFEVIRWLM